MSCTKVILSESKKSLATVERDSTNKYPRSRPRPGRDHLKSSVLEELWSIWRADPRVPSVKSRRSWAVSRDANPRLVDSWFRRRRTCSRKTGQPIPNGSYDLSPEPRMQEPPEPKQIRWSETPTELEPEVIVDLPSDDTQVFTPDGDDLNHLEASSDTVFDADTLTELRRTESSAYKEVPRPEYNRSHAPSSTDVHTAEDLRFNNTPFIMLENPSFPVCNQSRGRGKQSNFPCILCSTETFQSGTAEGVLFDSGTTFDSRGALSITCSRLDLFPDTLMELSAIPFLFRTPPAVSPYNAVSNSWTIVEDELGHLVKDGKLDFSFLDVPHLASMDLLD